MPPSQVTKTDEVGKSAGFKVVRMGGLLEQSEELRFTILVVDPSSTSLTSLCNQLNQNVYFGIRFSALNSLYRNLCLMVIPSNIHLSVFVVQN